MASNWSVTWAMALTNTAGLCSRRALTIPAERSMARASSTEVPPNFITIIGVDSSGSGERGSVWMAERRRLWSKISLQVTLSLQQLGVEQGRPGFHADRVVR